MKKSLLLIIIATSFSLISFSQNRTSEGKVYNMGGGVLTEVRVFAKQDPAIFTLSDEKGSFKLGLTLLGITNYLSAHLTIFSKP